MTDIFSPGLLSSLIRIRLYAKTHGHFNKEKITHQCRWLFETESKNGTGEGRLARGYQR